MVHGWLIEWQQQQPLLVVGPQVTGSSEGIQAEYWQQQVGSGVQMGDLF